MKKISVLACVCACFLTVLLTLSCVFFFNRFVPRLSKVDESYSAEDKLSEAAEIIRDNYIGEYNESVLSDSAIDAMIESLDDRWSYYMTAEEVESYLRSSQNSYGGIGIVVQNDTEQIATILKVYTDSPAGQANIQPGSRFLTVDEENVTGLDMDSVVEKIRAAISRGKIVLRLLCPDGSEEEYELIPGDVFTNPVSYELLESGLGYIRLDNFEGRSAQDGITAIKQLVSESVPGIIFDMRENPGGQLNELLEILDFILPEGKLFISRNIDGSESVDYSDASCVTLPMVVLVNEDTYSAAEFFAAALREYGWAKLVGAQTSGKGYAQITVPMTDGSAIHISHIAYYTPNGECLAGVGLTPDITVAMGEEERTLLYYGMLSKEDDIQLQEAEKLLIADLDDLP